MTENEKIAVEALRQTELRLEDLAGLASNADQRAMALAGACVALVATLLIFSSKDTLSQLNAVAVFCLLLAAITSISSCAPRSFHVRGHFWRDWKGHIDDGDRYYDAIVAQAAENDDRIDSVEASLSAAASRLRLAFFQFCLGGFFILAGQFLIWIAQT